MTSVNFPEQKVRNCCWLFSRKKDMANSSTNIDPMTSGKNKIMKNSQTGEEKTLYEIYEEAARST